MAVGVLGRHDLPSLMKFVSKIPGVENIGSIIDIPATVAGSATFMIILGSVMVFFGFFGCFGACCMLKSMLFIVSNVLDLASTFKIDKIFSKFFRKRHLVCFKSLWSRSVSRLGVGGGASSSCSIPHSTFPLPYALIGKMVERKEKMTLVYSCLYNFLAFCNDEKLADKILGVGVALRAPHHRSAPDVDYFTRYSRS